MNSGMILKAEILTILFPSLVKVSSCWARCYFLLSVRITNWGSASTQALRTPHTFSLHRSVKKFQIISLFRNYFLTLLAIMPLLWMISFLILTLDSLYMPTYPFLKKASTSCSCISGVNFAINCMEMILFSSSQLFSSSRAKLSTSFLSSDVIL